MSKGGCKVKYVRGREVVDFVPNICGWRVGVAIWRANRSTYVSGAASWFQQIKVCAEEILVGGQNGYCMSA